MVCSLDAFCTRQEKSISKKIDKKEKQAAFNSQKLNEQHKKQKANTEKKLLKSRSTTELHNKKNIEKFKKSTPTQLINKLTPAAAKNQNTNGPTFFSKNNS